MSFKSASLKSVVFFISLNALLWLIANCFWKDENTALLHTSNLIITLCIIIVLIINSYLLANIRSFSIFRFKVKEII